MARKGRDLLGNWTALLYIRLDGDRLRDRTGGDGQDTPLPASDFPRELKADPLGPPIYWIVPRQATFSTERMLLESFGPFARCRVTSFETLGTEVLGRHWRRGGGADLAARQADDHRPAAASNWPTG